MRDSNSRYGITAHTLSRRAPSTTRTTLHVLSKIKLFTSATLASLARFKESCQEKKKAAQQQILRVHIILDRRKNMREFVCLSSRAIILPFPYCTLHKICIIFFISQFTIQTKLPNTFYISRRKHFSNNLKLIIPSQLI